MIQKVFNFSLKSFLKITDLRKLIFNFVNYGSYQLITYLSYLIIIPYIVRVIGNTNFGIINLALALVTYLAIISEFGFPISGVQYIAQNQTNRKKRTEIVANIISLQILLMLTSFIFLVFFVNLIPKFYSYQTIFYFTFLIIPSNILMSIWFYIGMEKIKYLSLLMLVSKFLYIVSIFVFVKKPEDYFFVPLLNGITAIFSGLLSICIIIFKFKVYPVYLKSIDIIKYIQNNWNIFLSILSINLYRNSNVIILGFIVSESIVGIYSGGEKIVIAIQSIFAPITQVVFPYISRLKVEDPSKSKNALILLTAFIGLGTILISLLLFFFADEIALLILGEQFIKSGMVIRISSFVVFFGTLNFILGIIFMTNYGMKKEFTRAVVFTGIINVILCSIFSYIWHEIGTAFSFLGAELILTSLLLYFINKKYQNIFKIVFNSTNGFSNAR